MQYQEYLKDKTVAIVGSSSHLIDRNEGEFIDSHDVVVRTNNSSFIPEELLKDYGNRLDVGYFWHPVMRYTDKQELRSKGMKYAFLSKARHAKAGLELIHVNHDKNWLTLNNIPHCEIDYYQYLCYLECNVSPHSGMISIYHLLQQPLKSLYVTGFSFLRESTIEVKEGYEIVPNKDARDAWESNDRVPIGEAVWRRNHIEIPQHEFTVNKWLFTGSGKIIDYDGDDYVVQWNDTRAIETRSRDGIRVSHNGVAEEKVFFKWAANDPRIKLDSYLSNFVP